MGSPKANRDAFILQEDPLASRAGVVLSLGLVLIRQTLPHRGCIRVRWDREDNEVPWISLFVTAFPRLEVIRSLFDQFSRACIPEDSSVCGILHSDIRQEYDEWIKEFRSEGLEFLTAADIWSKRGRVWRIMKSGQNSGDILVSGLDWGYVSRLYHETDTWSSTSYKFLISPKPLQHWVDDLLILSNQRIDKSFLRRVGTVLLSYYEHGMEALGFDVPIDAVEHAAENLSQTLQVPLHLKERSAP